MCSIKSASNKCSVSSTRCPAIICIIMTISSIEIDSWLDINWMSLKKLNDNCTESASKLLTFSSGSAHFFRCCFRFLAINFAWSFKVEGGCCTVEPTTSSMQLLFNADLRVIVTFNQEIHRIFAKWRNFDRIETWIRRPNTSFLIDFDLNSMTTLNIDHFKPISRQKRMNITSHRWLYRCFVPSEEFKQRIFYSTWNQRLGKVFTDENGAQRRFFRLKISQMHVFDSLWDVTLPSSMYDVFEMLSKLFGVGLKSR